MDTEKTVDLVTYLEDEVSNGGFHQFFHNSSGNHTAEMICALETIEAFAMAEIVRRAAGKFPGGTPPKERPERQEALWKNFPATHEFDELNEEFFAYPDNLSKLLESYTSNSPIS